MAKIAKFIGLPVVILILLAALLISSWLNTYRRFTHEALVAEITFEPMGEKLYRARLATGDLCDVTQYDLYGDQWRIEAQFIKWKYWASLLGFDSMYRLDRIEGRYEDVIEQNQRRKMAYALPRATTFDMVSVADTLGRLNFLLDASYGSSTFDRIDVAKTFRIYKTQTGLITRSEPRNRIDDNGQRLRIQIDRACGAKPGPWRRLSEWVDGELTKVTGSGAVEPGR